MARIEAHSGCHETCPHLEPVRGACTHDLRPLLVMFFREHPEESCPVYEQHRSTAMQQLSQRIGKH